MCWDVEALLSRSVYVCAYIHIQISLSRKCAIVDVVYARLVFFVFWGIGGSIPDREVDT